MHNKSFIFLILVLISFSIEYIIKEAVYYIMYDNLFFNYQNKALELTQSSKTDISSNFRIKKNHEVLNNSFYYIEDLKFNNYLSLSENKELIFIPLKPNIKESISWNFIKTRDNNYLIFNKNKCFLKIRNFNINCENIPLEQATEFIIIELYEEVKQNKYNIDLIEKEPIDILIKYIDLRDPLLKRDEIHQIKKDYDNEELRYSLRSIIKNIPWIRKIFILMPNDNVSYLKEYDLIKDKIIYIKDKDLIGFDSSSSLAFQFRYWKMKDFGISNNFIVLDDDYFIGSPLKKSDFFYVNNNKVVPAIITSNFIEIDRISAEKQFEFYKKIINQTKEEQTSEAFEYSLYLTYLYFIKMYNKTIIIPKYTHNAFPVNLIELKEIFDEVNRSEYKATTLDCKYRHVDSFQFQTFCFSYYFLKYNKKVNNIPYKYIQNKYSIFGDYNTSLFCINTGSIYYSPISFFKTRIIMEYLFPNPTDYEVINNSLPYLSFNVVYSMEQELNKYQELNNELIQKNKLNNFFSLLTCFNFILLIYWKFNFNNIFYKNKLIKMKEEEESIIIK